MGQINHITDRTVVGNITRETEVSVQADSTELGLLLAAIREHDCEPNGLDPSNDPEEVCQVPRSDLEGEAEPAEGINWRAVAGAADRELGDQRKRWDIQEASLSATQAHLDDARGAARIMADALGIENSERSHVAKLIKLCLGHVEFRRDEYNSMTDEMANMARAMSRFGLQPPDPVEDEPMHRYCQRLAHNLDTLKGDGWRLGNATATDSVSEGRAVAHLTDEQRMEKINALQGEMGLLMEGGAIKAGFIKEGMSKAEYVQGLQKWAVSVDNARRVDKELAKMAEEGAAEDVPAEAPQTDAEKLAARTKPAIDQFVEVKVELESEEEARQRHLMLDRIEDDRGIPKPSEAALALRMQAHGDPIVRDLDRVAPVKGPTSGG